MKKTKIICSIGPVSCEPDIMEKMVLAGMNVGRINFSHATLEEKVSAVNTIKEVRKRTGSNVAILYDTKGPDLRTCNFENDKIELIDGENIRIVKDDIIGTKEQITLNFKEVISNLKKGDNVLLDDGLLTLEVISVEEDGVTCKIIHGGVIKSRRGTAVPGVDLGMPFLSEQDKEDIIYACNHEGDFLALSFVTCAQDVLEVKEILKSQNREDLQIIAKIESKTAIKNLDEIIAVSEGIMVARGDLGVEVPMAELPILQKLMVQKAREQGKTCVVATEMLASMYESARPTRAEVSDIANAVFDGTDAIMLSGETTIGKHPIDAVKFMAEIAENAEKHSDFEAMFGSNRELDVTEVIADSVVYASNLIDAKLIVAATISGYTAKKISNLKPNALILAGCPNEKIANSLALNYGVYSTYVPEYGSTDEVLNDAKQKAMNFMNLNEGDKIVITGGFPKNSVQGTTNLMKIETI
ncbi:MAG: pyruvate kinase [Bacilli bacterium]